MSIKLTPKTDDNYYMIGPGQVHTFEFFINPMQVTNIRIQHVDSASQDASLRATLINPDNYQMLFVSDSLDTFHVPRIEREIQIIDSLISGNLPSLAVGRYLIQIQNQQNSINNYRLEIF